MHLILSSDSPGDTTISDSTTSQVLYRCSTPSKGTVNISKVLPNDSEHDHMRDRFAHLAQIEWHGPTTSIFRYQGNESFTKDFFKHEGKTGRCVRWSLSIKICALTLKNYTEGVDISPRLTVFLICGSSANTWPRSVSLLLCQ
jgi:hypothetical protein